jgi:chorismate synthase
MEILGGPLFAVAGAGESHGPAITTIVFGCPPGVFVERSRIQTWLDRRRPGSNKHGTPRREEDTVVLLSGIYSEDHERLIAGPRITVDLDGQTAASTGYEDGFTTGEPIASLVLSTSQKSGDYAQFAGALGEVRPGHTDLVKHYKSRGFVDVRGGGRSSYRATISDVIGGSIARIMLHEVLGTQILSSIVQVGPLRAQRTLSEQIEALQRQHAPHNIPAEAIRALQSTLDAAAIYAFDTDFAAAAAELIKQTRIAGDSLGAVVEVVAVNVPPLLGDPLYASLKLRLMGALGGLHAVQGVEIGAGFAAAERRGSANNDPIRSSGYQSNSHGGLIGGISTGSPLVMRVAFKPTSSISLPQQSVRKNLDEIEFELRKGRHDPCVGVRAGVTLESRLAIELANAALAQQAAHLSPDAFRLFNQA